MKKEIENLLTCAAVCEENQYPGYPFQMTVIVDCETEEFWVDRSPKSIEEALAEIYARLMNNVIGCDLCTKGSWLIRTEVVEPQKYINCSEDNFYIDDMLAARFYFALSAAIYRCRDSKKFIWAVIDEDCEYIDVKEFDTLEQITQYKDDYYFNGEE